MRSRTARSNRISPGPRVILEPCSSMDGLALFYGESVIRDGLVAGYFVIIRTLEALGLPTN